MIGLFAGECSTAFEFRPIAASTSMRWATLVIKKPLPEKYWGEWGFAFGKHHIWIFSGNQISFFNYPRVKR
tara:strand:- start:329 stop:541 length:213 start_codon:yes stop_codon:yes gene_type:complete